MDEETIIKVENLSRLFGLRKHAAREMLKKGRSKDEILKKTDVTVAIDDVSFEVTQGSIFVIIGLSGSGKSTVVRCLNMLQAPSSGKIWFEGRNVKDFSKDELRDFRREKISMVFQSFGLMDHRDVLSNVTYGLEVRGMDKKEREERAREMIALVGLEGWEQTKTDSLSGGMKQRVGIARALANDPEILLMDEPFSALDPLVRKEMQYELLSIQEKLNKTIIFITHDIDEAFKLGDRIAIMKDGKIVQIASPEDMAANPADDYVKNFINSADKSQVFSVKNIMRTPNCLIRPRNGANNALKLMRDRGLSSAFVVSDRLSLVGLLTLDNALKVVRKELSFDEAIITEIPRTTEDTQVADLIPIAAEASFPIAVVDENNRFQGIVTKAAVLTSLV